MNRIFHYLLFVLFRSFSIPFFAITPSKNFIFGRATVFFVNNDISIQILHPKTDCNEARRLGNIVAIKENKKKINKEMSLNQLSFIYEWTAPIYAILTTHTIDR